jgi:isopropylmalate/homocitrate/citramalate synthase
MTRERLYFFDTTLRDGQQTQGVQFSNAEKQQIAVALDAIGVDYIEGGWPGAKPTDSDFFADAPPDPRHDDCVQDDQPGRPVDDFGPAKLEALQ